MAMLNLAAYATTSIHHAQALLTQARGAGITEIDVLLAEITQHLHKVAMVSRREIAPAERRQGRERERTARATRTSGVVCPACGLGTMVICRESSAIAGAPVSVCSRNCGYSRVENK